MISILVADDHGIVREGLRRVLEAEQEFKVAGEASDGREVLERVRELKPQVVVLDISMPRLGGLETRERLRSNHPDVKVILLSVHGDAPMIHSAISLGADGYVLKDGRTAEIVTAAERLRPEARGSPGLRGAIYWLGAPGVESLDTLQTAGLARPRSGYRRAIGGPR